ERQHGILCAQAKPYLGIGHVHLRSQLRERLFRAHRNAHHVSPLSRSKRAPVFASLMPWSFLVSIVDKMPRRRLDLAVRTFLTADNARVFSPARRRIAPPVARRRGSRCEYFCHSPSKVCASH